MSDIELRHGPRSLNARSLLFAPGSDERKLVKALGSAADAVVADLEDAVAATAKDAARALVAAPSSASRHGPGPAAARPRQRAETAFFADDLAAVAAPRRRTAIVLPKATPERRRRSGRRRPAGGRHRRDRRRACGSPSRSRRGRASLRSRSARSTSAPSWGSSRGRTGCELLVRPLEGSCSTRPRRASASPFDVVHLDVRDGRRARATSAGSRARSAFAARRASTRRRSPIVNAPSRRPRRRVELGPEECSRPTRQPRPSGRGAVAVDGAMVDLPVVERARRLLAEAKRR